MMSIAATRASERADDENTLFRNYSFPLVARTNPRGLNYTDSEGATEEIEEAS